PLPSRAMYSKLFTAGLQANSSSWQSSEPTSSSSSGPSESSSSSRYSRRQTTAFDIASPTSAVDPSNPIYFTVKPKPHGNAHRSRVHSSRPTEAESSAGGSFLVLDNAPGPVATTSKHRASNSISRALPKPKPLPSAHLPQPPPQSHQQPSFSSLPPTPVIREPDTELGKFSRRYSSSNSTAPSSRPSVVERRVNRNEALAALEGRTRRSFWDETDNDDDLHPSPSPASSRSSFNSPGGPITPNSPLNSVNLNIPSHVKRQHRQRSSTIETWGMPNFIDLVSEGEESLRSKRETMDAAEWSKVVGLSLGLVS
ncbi:hypothetical protein SISSUDRAFT_1040509, partial [Sistotremastrum suecicum HHB10207 ss-3]